MLWKKKNLVVYFKIPNFAKYKDQWFDIFELIARRICGVNKIDNLCPLFDDNFS